MKDEKTLTKDCKLVGVMLPQPIAEYLTLYGLLKGKTKSNIVRTMINIGYTDLHKNLSQKQLIITLTKVYQKEWNNLKKGIPMIDKGIEKGYSDFQCILIDKMRYKSVTDETIMQIISKIKM